MRRYLDGRMPHLPLLNARVPALQEELKVEIVKAVRGM